MTPPTPRSFAVAAALAVLAVVPACGSDVLPPPPVAVPLGLVPATLEPNLGFEEFTAAKQTFAEAGPKSLVADGRLWQIRRGAQLLGTLQISTLKPEVSTANPKDRKDILQSVLTGTPYETIDVSGVPVAAATAADRTLFVWFGAKLFQVLQLKGSKVEPDKVIAALIDHELATGLLQPVGSVDEENIEGGS